MVTVVDRGRGRFEVGPLTLDDLDLDGDTTMDATRKRRTRDRARQAWYAGCRQRRFARFLGFVGAGSMPPSVSRDFTGHAPLTVSEAVLFCLRGSRVGLRRVVASELVKG
jgi:hypothetical protein